MASPYLQQLEAILSPVPNFADTLITPPEANDADDENVSFLRAPLRSSPDSSSSRNRRRRPLHPPDVEADSMDTDDQRTVRMTVEINRRIPMIRRHRDGSNIIPNYEAHLSNVRSLYGWAPGSDDDDDERTYDPPHESIGTWFARSSDREAGRSGAGLRSSRREAPGRIPSSFGGESSEAGLRLLRYGDSYSTAEALLQSVRRQPRFSRTRPLQHYLQDRERGSQEVEERDRTVTVPVSRSRTHRFTPSSRGDSTRNLSHNDIRARSHAHRHMYAEDPVSVRLKEAIKYLDRVRYSISYEESVSSAEKGGFTQCEYLSSSGDFILDTSSIVPPSKCSWLQPGTIFSGSQCAGSSSNSLMFSHRMPSTPHSNEPMIVNGSEVGRISMHSTGGLRYFTSNPYPPTGGAKDDNWPVKVTIHGVDYDAMTLSGTMEAYNIPDKTSPTRDAHIVTFLEGEIVDFNIHTLETTSFKADADIDSTYWRQLQPFRDLTDDEMIKNIVSKRWITEELTQGWILMRWKERCFLTPTDARQGLTISGFYYISLCRNTGKIEGLYYDPGSSPYQQLSLKPQHREMVFPAYDFR
ncbi:hypothetical protein Egran_05398 [Elaphomyces granulatus]|uniref:Vacuolar import and degradation protein-domain-containing protein n=1 Tax=Elaphomyces granulatus TaxID=519963 RepID=A0A232LRP9_9EURO|nr:hypothetical protein Egran_05398 [Elaphomyces granulatus]